MNLLVLKGDTKVFAGQVESRVEVVLVLASLGFGVAKTANGFHVTYEGENLSPQYTLEWDPEDIPYDALRSGYLSRATQLTFIKIDKYF